MNTIATGRFQIGEVSGIVQAAASGEPREPQPVVYAFGTEVQTEAPELLAGQYDSAAVRIAEAS